jgi:transposase
MRKFKVTLDQQERDSLVAITQKGKHPSRKVLNALILLNCDQGKFQNDPLKNEDVAAVLKISMRKIDRVKKRFVEEGLDAALNGRRGQRVYERKADGDFEAHLLALSCSQPPDGFSQWSLRLLADRLVELNYIDSISYETVRRVLIKRNSNPGKRKGG